MTDIHFLGWGGLEKSIETKFQMCTVDENGPKWGFKKAKSGFCLVFCHKLCTMSILMTISDGFGCCGPKITP